MINKATVLYNIQHLQHLVFEVTDACNLNCSYCAYSSLYEDHDKREFKNLPFRKAQLIIDYIMKERDLAPDVNYPLTVSFYGGEPLLNFPLIERVVNYLENSYFLNKKITFGMTTNAMLLDKYMDFLAKKQFRLTISLDGDEQGQSYRIDHSGKNSFSRVIKNIKLLKEKYPVYFENNIVFNAVIHKMNNVESTYRFIMDTFGKAPLFAPLNPIGIRKDKISDFISMHKNINESIALSRNCELLEAELFMKSPKVINLVNHVFRKSENVYFDYNDLIFDIVNKSDNKTGTCPPFSKKMFITVNGKILQCERIGHQFALGLVDDNCVNLNLESVVDKQNDYISKISKQCENCYLKKECPECVYNIENISNKNVRCKSFCNKSEYEIMKVKTTDYLREHPNYYERILNEVDFR